MSLKPILDAPGFMKDMNTGAILNTDNNSLHAYRKRKAAVANQTERIEQLEHNVSTVLSDLDEIKQMLKAIVGK